MCWGAWARLADAWRRLCSPWGAQGLWGMMFPWGCAHWDGIALPEHKSSPSPLLSATWPYPGRCCGWILATPAAFSRADEAIAARGARRSSGGCEDAPGLGMAACHGGTPNFWGSWSPSPMMCSPARQCRASHRGSMGRTYKLVSLRNPTGWLTALPSRWSLRVGWEPAELLQEWRWELVSLVWGGEQLRAVWSPSHIPGSRACGIPDLELPLLPDALS